VNSISPKGSQALLKRIMDLHKSGLNLEEVTERIFIPDQEAAMFRMRLLVEVAVEYGDRYYTEEKNQ